MRNKISYITVVILLAFAAIAIPAQDYKKYEVFAGYTYANYDNVLETIDNGVDPTISLRGFNASFTGNVHKYVGLKFDYSLTAQREDFADPSVTLEVKYKNNQVLGGVQFKDNRDDAGRWKPFAHVLAGVSNQRFNAKGSVISSPPTVNLVDESLSTNNFAMVFGAGLDVKVHKNVDIRLIQFDYNPVFFGDQRIDTYNIPGVTQNNIRMSFGVVFH